MVFDATMTEPFPEIPDGSADQSILDRSRQAARFLDLARQHALAPDDPPELIPLIAARLHDAKLAETDGPDLETPDTSDLVDPDLPGADLPGGVPLGSAPLGPGPLGAGRDDPDDDVRIDAAAFGVPHGDTPVGGFRLDDDGDVFGDGNGFGAGGPFGADDDPLDPFD